MRIQTPKPCPFCGSADVYVEAFGMCTYGVVCNNCYAVGPKVEHGKYMEAVTDDLSRRDAIRMWNARNETAHKRVLVACEMLATSEM